MIQIKNKLLTYLLLIGMAVSATPIFSYEKSINIIDEGTYIGEVSNETGPLFYPASYDHEINGEPSYITQKGYTFDSMNFTKNVPHYYRGESVKVAVIDSGLNYTHEDFIYDGNQIIQPRSRTIDSSSGSWKFYQFAAEPDKEIGGYPTKINDTLGHGTNVASVIASQINALGCAGIAPNVDLYVYKVTNTKNGYEWYAIQSALQYCIDEGMDVINMSFQSYEHAVSYGEQSMAASSGCSTVLTNYINNCYDAGITLVAAAGNFNTSEPSYPASNNHVISVGALAESSTTTKADYSNTYGIDLVAPGTVYVAGIGSNSTYKKTYGTSFSSPIVTAAIALYKQLHPSATPSQIESALYASCDSIAGNPSWAGNGRLNLENFLGISYPSIEITSPSDEELEINVNDTYQLEWTVDTQGLISDEVEFSLLFDEGAISIDENGLITALSEGEEIVEIKSVDDPEIHTEVAITVIPESTSISLNRTSLTLKEGDTFTLEATVTPTPLPVTFTSSNVAIATVNSSSGLITAKKKGSAIITASTSDGASATCTLTINKADLSSIAISGTPKTSYYTSGTFVKPTIIATYANGATENVTNSSTFSGYSISTPGNQTVTVSYTENGITKSLTYNITVIAVELDHIEVSGSYKTKYIEGDTFSTDNLVVKAYYNDGSNKTVNNYVVDTTTPLTTIDTTWTISYTEGGVNKTINISITVSEASDYVLVTSSTSLSIGDKVVIKTLDNLGVTGQNGNKDATVSTEETEWKKYEVKDNGTSFKLYDNDAKKYIASVSDNAFKYDTSVSNAGSCSGDSDGHFKVGSRFLCVNGSVYRLYTSIGSFTPFYIYKIATPSVTSVTVSPSSVQLDLNGTTSTTLSVEVVTVKGASSEVTWSSSNPSVVTVSDGEITALAVGSATITATSTFDDTKKGTCTVTVIDSTPIPVSSIVISGNNELQQGKSTNLTATINPSTATVQTLQWESSHPSIISINETTGKTLTITALGNVNQSATITARATDGSGVNTSFTVTIVDRVTLTNVELTNYNNSVPYMDDYSVGSVTVTAYFSDGNSQVVTPTSTNYSVDTSEVGKHTISASYTYEGESKTGYGTVKVTNDGASGNVGVDSEVETITETPVTYTFTGKNDTSGTVSGLSYSVSGSTIYEDRGLQFSKTSGTVTISGFGSKDKIKSVTAVCSANCSSSISCKVGGSDFGSPPSLSIANKENKVDKTFTGNASAGNITLTYSKGSSSTWIKGFTVVYDKVTTEEITYKASPTEQAISWSNYFLNSVKPNCDISGVNSDVDAIKDLWSDLAFEYRHMIASAKDEFVDGSDSSIMEARQLYLILMKNYQSILEDDFVTDGSNNKLMRFSYMFNSITKEPANLVAIIVSSFSLLSMCAYIIIKKKKIHD